MRESIGLTYTLNFVILFIVITFAFLFGIMSYYKAFKVNSRIANAIENHEGYNSLSINEINNTLSSLGYRKGNEKCSTRKYKGNVYTAIDFSSNNYAICVYEYPVNRETGYFRYGIVTYIYLDVPVVGQTLKLPIYSETEKIYKFSA